MSLVLVERYILESLAKGKQNIRDLQKDTGIEIKKLWKILENLEKQGLIYKEIDKIRINILELNKMKEWGTLKNELIDIFESFLNAYQKQKPNIEIKYKKFHLNLAEEKMFKGLLANLENFMVNIEQGKNRDAQGRTKNQKIILWASGEYSSLVDL